MRQQLDVVLTWRPGKRDAAEVILIVGTLPLYYLARGLTETRVDEAVQRGIDIVRVEQSLGIFWEVELQSWALSYGWLIKFLNWFYLFGHLPVIGVLAVWMYFWHRPQYLLMRNAFLLSGAIALIFYVNFPTAPPRLLPDSLGYNFVDTVFDQYNTGRPWTPGEFVNEYAAFPSMHIGWNALAGIAMWLATRNFFVRAFAVIMPSIMLADIVLTGNHYIIDAFAGFVVMMIGLGIAVGAKKLATRIVSPDSKDAREKGWVSWMYWFCGVAYEPRESRGQRTLHTA
ncbi:MAG: phosphatase PAP2 family protein [Dehalococcoidia bacterium]